MYKFGQFWNPQILSFHMSTRRKSFYVEMGEKITFEVLQLRSAFVTGLWHWHFWVLLCFPAYLRQFKSKSHIQGHSRKEEIKSFHLTPRMIGLQALLMYLWALKKGRKVCWRSLYIKAQKGTHPKEPKSKVLKKFSKAFNRLQRLLKAYKGY